MCWRGWRRRCCSPIWQSTCEISDGTCNINELFAHGPTSFLPSHNCLIDKIIDVQDLKILGLIRVVNACSRRVQHLAGDTNVEITMLSQVMLPESLWSTFLASVVIQRCYLTHRDDR